MTACYAGLWTKKIGLKCPETKERGFIWVTLVKIYDVLAGCDLLMQMGDST